MENEFPINIRLNSIQIVNCQIQNSAMKHFGEKSEDIYKYICTTLDGQYRNPENNLDNYGEYKYLLASSCIGDDVPKTSDFRDTIFKIKGNTIIFYHGCERKKEWYDKAKNEWKIRQE